MMPIWFPKLLRELKPQGRVVLCHGCYDIITPGHIKHFEWARERGEVLIVSVTSDRFVNKGEGRPIFNEDLRCYQVNALKGVDQAFINDSEDAVPLIKLLKPDFYVKGGEYKDNFTLSLMREMQEVEANGGRTVFSETDFEFHTTELINEIKS